MTLVDLIYFLKEKVYFLSQYTRTKVLGHSKQEGQDHHGPELYLSASLLPPQTTQKD